MCVHGMSGHRLEKPARRFACCAKSLKKQENKKEKDFHADGASHTDTASLSLSLYLSSTHTYTYAPATAALYIPK